MTLESVLKCCESYPFKGARQESCERSWGQCSGLSQALTGSQGSRGGTELPSGWGAPLLCSLCPCLPPWPRLGRDSQLWGTRSKGDLEGLFPAGKRSMSKSHGRPGIFLRTESRHLRPSSQSWGQEERGSGGRMPAAGTGAGTCGRPPRATLFLQLCDPGIAVLPPREETEAQRGLVTCPRSHSLGV